MINNSPTVWDVIAQATEQIRLLPNHNPHAYLKYNDYLVMNGWKRLPRKLKKKIFR